MQRVFLCFKVDQFFLDSLAALYYSYEKGFGSFESYTKE